MKEKMAESRKKYKVNAERQISMAFYLNKISELAFQRIKENGKNQILDIINAMLFCGLTLESLLNDIGYRIYYLKENDKNQWKEYEKMQPEEKLLKITDKLKIKIEFNKLPFQYFKTIFKFRNSVVHSKLTIKREIIDLAELEDDFSTRKPLQEKWEKVLTLKNAENWRKSVGIIADFLYTQARLPNPLEITNVQYCSLIESYEQK